jgi:hypothetical protein
MRRIAVGLVAIMLLASCTDDPTVDEPAAAALTVEPTGETAPENDGLFPTVVASKASTSDGESWRVDVTLLSGYDAPARYADAWRVLDADDNELGIRVLTHDHAGEQPFTRSETVVIPAEVTTVFIEGRDQQNGWSGQRFELTLDR